MENQRELPKIRRIVSFNENLLKEEDEGRETILEELKKGNEVDLVYDGRFDIFLHFYPESRICIFKSGVIEKTLNFNSETRQSEERFAVDILKAFEEYNNTKGAKEN